MRKTFFYSIMAIVLLSSGCKKFLAEKSDQRLTVPETVEDLQSILDNYSVMNSGMCAAGEISSDDYYLKNEDYNALSSDYEKRIYIWDKENLFPLGADVNDWNNCYRAVYSCNSVIQSINDRGSVSSDEGVWDNLLGQAYFFRGFRIFDASLIWCKAYDQNTAVQDLGLPVRTTTDFNVPSERASLLMTYRRIVDDLKSATKLLPETQISTFRPSKKAAYSALARVYIYMGDFDNALKYADTCLSLSSQLMDYNTLDSILAYPVLRDYNDEALFYGTQSIAYPLVQSTPKIDTALYDSYDDDDLRKSIFFTNNPDGSHSFKGSYKGDYTLFAGVSTDEIYLIKAECLARLGDITKGIEILNAMLITRWKKNNGVSSFVPVNVSSREEAIKIILEERRKELLFRGLRWMDLKRLNLLGENTVLKRRINGVTYELPPNDLRYALPLPDDIIVNSSLEQNPR